MSKLKLWRYFSLFMVLLLMSSLVAVVPAPVQANVSGITANPYDTRIIGLNTGYRITMTTGATLSAGDNVTVEFPSGTTVPDFSATPERVFVQDTACGTVVVAVQQVTVIIPTITPIVPGQQFTVTFNQSCNITNPITSGSNIVTVWTTKEPVHVTSSSYEITAVKVYTGATKHSENATIQDAIDAAISGDTITVPAGTFTENVNVNKSLTLQGASSATVIVTAVNPAVSVFNVTASSVNISGFTITGANVSTTAGIYLGNDVANCNIHDNILTGNGDGIWLGLGSNNNIINNNNVSSNTYQGFEIYGTDYNTFTNNTANSNAVYGFKMESVRYNTFTGNTANSNGKYGFYLTVGTVPGGTGCNDNTFTNNTANSNAEYGIRMNSSSGNTFTGNTFNSNGLEGMRLKDVISSLTLNNNSFSGNPVGINIAAGAVITSVTVSNNNITGNTSFGISNSGTGTVDAKHNYWNNASGPSHDGLNYGDNVTANVTFRPWLVATYTGTPPVSEIAITTTSPLPDGNTGYTYSTPLSATGGSGTYTWARYSGTVPPGLSFVGSNFSGTPTQVNADPGFNFFVKVSDGIQATSENFTMKVYGGALVITTTSPLPGGTKNVPYGPETLHAIGGTGIYTWSLNVGSGPLPTGLGLASDGKISGTPTVTGTFPFNVKVECGGSTPGYKDLSITISAAPIPGLKLIGAASDDTGSNNHPANYIFLTRFAADSTGSLTQIRLKASAPGNAKVAIYTDNVSVIQPGALLNSTADTGVSVGWNTITIPSTTIAAGTYYWLAVRTNTTGSSLWGASGTGAYKPLGYASPWPDPAGTGYTSLSYHSLVAGWAAVTVTAPTVTNSPVSDKTQTSARLNGNVGGTGGENPTVIIYWGDNNGATDPYAWDNSPTLGTKELGAFYKDIPGLTGGTLYYYRCFAANSGGSDWADSSESFTTSALSAPTVTNSTGASIVTATSARLNGAITGTGGVNPTVIIYWGDNDGVANQYNWDNTVPLGVKDVEAFYTDITDLNSGTKYYYRSFASNLPGGTWAASSENFTTLSGAAAQKLIGAASDDTGSNLHAANYIFLTRYAAENNGSLTEIKLKASTPGNAKAAIYADSGGQPGALLNSTASTVVSVGWNTITIPSTAIAAGTNYWLAVRTNTTGSSLWGASGTGAYKPLDYASNWPDPAGTGYTSLSYHSLVAGWATTVATPPAPPTIATPKKTITFEWNAPSGATKYRLQVNTSSGFEPGTMTFEDNNISATSQDVALPVGSTYYWRVKAGNTGGWSGWSSTGSVTP